MTGCGRLLSYVIALPVCALVLTSRGDASFVTVGTGANPLSEWGITVGDNNTSVYMSDGGPLTNPGHGTATYNGFQFHYMLEDTNDHWDHSQTIGPNQGGQDYDGEFLGVGTSQGRLVIAIVTGQRPDNGFAYFSPGDIRITTSTGDIFGIEVGGGAGGASGGAIVEGAPGSTYVVNSNGTTKGLISSDGTTQGNTNGSVNLEGGGTALPTTPSGQVAGSIWFNPAWILDPIVNPLTPVQLQLAGGEYVGMADFYYSRNSLTTQHAIIEVAIDFSLLKGAQIASVEWAPACGNDLLFVNNLALNTPEPASWLLLTTGGFCAFAIRRRRMLHLSA